MITVGLIIAALSACWLVLALLADMNNPAPSVGDFDLGTPLFGVVAGLVVAFVGWLW